MEKIQLTERRGESQPQLKELKQHHALAAYDGGVGGVAGLLVPVVTSTVTSPPSQFANHSWPAMSKSALNVRNSTAVRFAVSSGVESVVALTTTATEPPSAPPTPQLLWPNHGGCRPRAPRCPLDNTSFTNGVYVCECTCPRSPQHRCAVSASRSHLASERPVVADRSSVCTFLRLRISAGIN